MDLSPLVYLQPQSPSQVSRTVLIILNTPQPSPSLLTSLWPNANYRICADGGANRLHDLLPADKRTAYLPTAIHGDLDSLRPDVKAFYASHDVPVSLDSDLYSTDFCKALGKARDAAPDATHILVLGSIAGRVDQGLGLLHELVREQRARPGVQLMLFGEASCSFVLPRGLARIRVPVEKGQATENVGIVPVYGPARITLRGFEWDVQDWETEMGGQVSTSNHIKREVVEVETDREVLFTVELDVE